MSGRIFHWSICSPRIFGPYLIDHKLEVLGRGREVGCVACYAALTLLEDEVGCAEDGADDEGNGLEEWGAGGVHLGFLRVYRRKLGFC